MIRAHRLRHRMNSLLTTVENSLRSLLVTPPTTRQMRPFRVTGFHHPLVPPTKLFTSGCLARHPSRGGRLPLDTGVVRRCSSQHRNRSREHHGNAGRRKVRDIGEAPPRTQAAQRGPHSSSHRSNDQEGRTKLGPTCWRALRGVHERDPGPGSTRDVTGVRVPRQQTQGFTGLDSGG